MMSRVKTEYTAIFELGDDGWWMATCPEVPSAVGQGLTRDEAARDLASCIPFVLEFMRDEALKNLPDRAEHGTVLVG